MIKKNNSKDLLFLKTKIVRSLHVLLLREFLMKLFSFIGQLFLARILLPSDFGTYVIIIFLVNFFSLFSDLGFSWATIQKEKTPTQKNLSTIFFLRLTLSIILVIVIYSLAPFVKLLYHGFGESQVMMLRVFALTLIFAAVRSVPVSLLERKLKYREISFIDIYGAITYQFCAVILAVLHFGVWSFIYAVLLKEAVELIFAFSYEKWVPGKHIDIKGVYKMIRFGAFIQSNAILNFIHSSISPLIIGLRSGPYQVGLLDWASNIALIPMSITDNFGRVAFSGFSRVQGDKKLLSKAIQKSMSVLTIIILLFTVLILGFGNDLVKIFYSEKWQAAVPALYFFTAVSFFISAISPIGSGVLVLGRSKDILLVNVVTKISEWIFAFIFVLFFNYVGIAIAAMFSSIITFFSYLYIGRRAGISLNIRESFLKKLSVVVPVFIFIFITSFLPNVWQIFFGRILFAIIVYFATAYFILRSEIGEIMELVFVRKAK